MYNKDGSITSLLHPRTAISEFQNMTDGLNSIQLLKNYGANQQKFKFNPTLNMW